MAAGLPKWSFYPERKLVMPSTQALITQEDLYHEFQPICHLHTHKTIGYEALIRCSTEPRIDRLFRAAARHNMLFTLDTLSIYNAISACFADPGRVESDQHLFVNVFPSTLSSDRFTRFIFKLMQRYGKYANNIVFEINEAISEMDDWDTGQFLRNIHLLRECGFLVALDDVGEGATTLKRIVEIGPDFIKMDRFFAKHLLFSKQKQKLLKFFVDFCGDESNLILEGIEEVEDLRQSCKLGVPFGQGYLLAKPGPLPGRPPTSFRSIED
ncbi:EAL domain-containing protein [Paenibacillus sp. 32O-W]|uniref:EAL domain-containing protein n=1 Tax=Paenibacillus sp. 32O-W TaxID=1695218 RepID=UPI0021B53142|nr:EAL domain-containing protein [Paenibacillus sp. 32O-W]